MNKDSTYFSDSYVKEFECDVNNKMKLSSLMKVIQKVGSDQLNSLGITYGKMYATGVVFVLSKIGLNIYKMPECGDKYLLRTTPQKTHKSSFLRYTAMFNSNGEMIAECQTAWVIINPRERKILRPAEFKFNLPVDESSTIGTKILETRIKTAEKAKPVGVKEVRYSDLDINRHMNNCVYGDVIMDFLPIEFTAGREIKNLMIHYQNEACLGEKIEIKTDRAADNTFYVGGKKGEVKCFEAMITFKDEENN